MKFVFIGTSDLGIPALEKLKNLFELSFVITQPDRPAGRKQELTPPPVKIWAQKNNVRVLQPEKVIEAKDELIADAPGFILVASYGQIIPKEIINIPKFGSINIHPSLLPKYRGATPVPGALLNGEKETGVTLIKMDEEMDHGPIISRIKTEIAPNENFTSLFARLTLLAAELSADAIPKYIEGKLNPQIQDHARATFTKLFSKAEGKINWTNAAEAIHQQVMALNPEPGTWTMLEQKSVKILKTEVLMDNKIELAGKIYRSGYDMIVKCSDYSLKIVEIQPEGKKPMSGGDYLNGLKNLETKMFV